MPTQQNRIDTALVSSSTVRPRSFKPVRRNPANSTGTQQLDQNQAPDAVVFARLKTMMCRRVKVCAAHKSAARIRTGTPSLEGIVICAGGGL